MGDWACRGRRIRCDCSCGVREGKALFPYRIAQPVENSNTQQIGVMLYGQYMFAFEIASLLLLVAIIGAVVMAKKRI